MLENSPLPRLNVLIVQGELPNYRLPVFEALAGLPGVDITVTCCLDQTGGRRLGKHLKTQVARAYRLWAFRWHRHILESVRACDVAVVMFDLHWLSCLFIAIRYPRKTLLWGHGLGRSRLGNVLRLLIAKRSAGLLVYEHGAKSMLEARGFPPERLFVVGNTVSIHCPHRARSIRTTFVYVGRLREQKRINEFLHAFALARADLPASVNVAVVGDGPARGELEALTVRLGIADRVEFTGAVYDDGELACHFARAIAYISPGPVGLGVLHAFGHGVPVVTSRSGKHGPEVENIKDGVNGFLYAGGAEALGDLLVALSRDVELADRLGSNALLQYKNERTLGQMVERFARAIWSVAQRALPIT